MIKIDCLFIEVKDFQIYLSSENDFYISTTTSKFDNELSDFYIWKDTCLFTGNIIKGSIFKINIHEIFENILKFKFFIYDILSIFGRKCVKLILAIINNDYSQDIKKFSFDLPLVYNCKHLVVCRHLLVLISRLLIGPHRNFKNDYFFRCKCFIDNRVPMESYICLKTYSIALQLTSFSLKYLLKSSLVFKLIDLLQDDIVKENENSNVIVTGIENIGPSYAINSERLFKNKILTNTINCCEYDNAIYITENTFIRFLSKCIYNKYN